MSSIMDALQKLEEEKARQQASEEPDELDGDLAEEELLSGPSSRGYGVVLRLTPTTLFLIAMLFGLIIMGVAIAVAMIVVRAQSDALFSGRAVHAAVSAPTQGAAAVSHDLQQTGSSVTIQAHALSDGSSGVSTDTVDIARAAGVGPLAPLRPEQRPSLVENALYLRSEGDLPDETEMLNDVPSATRETEPAAVVEAPPVKPVVKPVPKPTAPAVEPALTVPAPPVQEPAYVPVYVPVPAQAGTLPGNAPVAPTIAPAVSEPVDPITLPVLTQGLRRRLGLPDLDITFIRLANESRPQSVAWVNYARVYVNDIIPNTNARVIGIELRGIGIDIGGQRYFVPVRH